MINNSICADMAAKWLECAGIDTSRVALILLRQVSVEWAKHCAEVIRYPVKPAATLWGQRHVTGFYARASARLRYHLSAGHLRYVLLPNNDNLLTNHVFRWTEALEKQRIRPLPPDIIVVAEGIMNYQQIGIANRAAWRWAVKRIIARVLGLRYQLPDGHLSGAFEQTTRQVVAFASEGLVAPTDKQLILPYPKVKPMRAADPAGSVSAAYGS